MEYHQIGDYVYDTSAHSFLGQGSYGSVFKCKKINSKGDYCVKIIQKEIGESFQKKAVIQLINLIKAQSGQNLVQVYDIYDRDEAIYIIMEVCDYDLAKEFKELQTAGTWYQEIDQIDIIQQLVNGFQQLYSMNIIHRDIKPQNILVKRINKKTINQQKIYKVQLQYIQISDFGLSIILKNISEKGNLTRVGTPSYTAPQLYFDLKFSGKCDIFSYGIVFYQLCFQGKFPYEGKGIQKLTNFLRNLEKQPIKCQIMKGNYRNQLSDLLERMLVFSEEGRIEFEEILKHPVLQINDENSTQDSLFNRFVVNVDQTKIQQANQEYLMQKQKSRLKRVNKLITVFYRKFLLIEDCIHKLEKEKSLNMMLIIFCLFYLGLQHLTYAFGIINCIPADIHPALSENIDFTNLIQILEDCQKAVTKQEFQEFQTQREKVQLQYFCWKKKAITYSDKLRIQILEQNEEIDFLEQVKSQRNDEAFFEKKINSIKGIGISKGVNQQIQKILKLNDLFPIKDYIDIDPDEIYAEIQA